MVSLQIAQRAPAIGVCLRHFASAASVRMRSPSPNNRCHIRKRAKPVAAPSRRDGHFSSIAPVNLEHRPSISHGAWLWPSTPGKIDSRDVARLSADPDLLRDLPLSVRRCFGIGEHVAAAESMMLQADDAAVPG